MTPTPTQQRHHRQGRHRNRSAAHRQRRCRSNRSGFDRRRLVQHQPPVGDRQRQRPELEREVEIGRLRRHPRQTSGVGDPHQPQRPRRPHRATRTRHRQIQAEPGGTRPERGDRRIDRELRQLERARHGEQSDKIDRRQPRHQQRDLTGKVVTEVDRQLTDNDAAVQSIGV